MTDDQILEALNAYNANPDVLKEALLLADVVPTGDAVADVRTLAKRYDIEPEQVLYGLFDEDSPLYAQEG